jgi:hypothetical protein
MNGRSDGRHLGASNKTTVFSLHAEALGRPSRNFLSKMFYAPLLAFLIKLLLLGTDGRV